MRHEVFHAGFATRDTVGFKQPHLRPADPKPITYGIVNFLRRGYSVFHKPQRFTPYGLQKTIRDMGIDFFFQMQRMHSNPIKYRAASLDQRCVIGWRGHHFDQRQKIDGVKGMADHDLLGPDRTGLQLRRFEP